MMDHSYESSRCRQPHSLLDKLLFVIRRQCLESMEQFDRLLAHITNLTLLNYAGTILPSRMWTILSA